MVKEGWVGLLKNIVQFVRMAEDYYGPNPLLEYGSIPFARCIFYIILFMNTLQDIYYILIASCLFEGLYLSKKVVKNKRLVYCLRKDNILMS